MILGFIVILLLSLPLGSSVAQTNRSSKLSALAERQEGAEEVANRVMNRFYETLDFKSIYVGIYVPDPLRTTEVRWTIRGFVWQSAAASRPEGLSKAVSIEFNAMERAYIARQNYEFLSSAVRFTHDNGAQNEFNAEFEQLYERLNKKRKKPILTSDDLDKAFTAPLNQLNDLLRKYVVATNFNSPRYRTAVASVQESRGEESSRMRELFHLRRQQRIFVVRREDHYLYFIERSGEFRMLSSTARIMD
jgi:hypothetical protein